MTNDTHRNVLLPSLLLVVLALVVWPTMAEAAEPEPAPTTPAPSQVEPATPTDTSAPAAPAPEASTSEPATTKPNDSWRFGAHAEVDLGILVFLKQGTGIAAGMTYGPFRAGLSYASFLSNPSLGGVPDGFDLRVNRLIGINAAYFIGQKTDRGFYVQGMLHIKEQGVTNKSNGAHVDLPSLAVGLEVGYVWKFYKGLYVAPRVGALYYVKTPQPGNQPVVVGDCLYDNNRHKNWDTYFIPTLSVGYSW